MRTNQPFGTVLKKAAFCAALLCLLLINAGRAHAQQSALTCSMTNAPMINPGGGGGSPLNGFTATTSGLWTGGSNNRFTDNNLDNSRQATVALGSTAVVTVSDNTDRVYSAGNYVGFVIEPTGIFGIPLNLDVLASIKIETLNASDAVVETRTGTSLVQLGLGGEKREIGFYTNSSYSHIRLTFGGLLAAMNVYYGFMRGTGSCTFNAAALACNANTPLSFPAYPVVAENSTTAVLAIGGITNLSNMVDNDPATAAAMVPVLSALGSHGVSVKNTVGQYPAGTYIGFDIENANILTADILGKYSIELYNDDGTVLQTIQRPSGLLGVDALNGSSRFVFGGVSTVAFDEARLVFNSTGLANVSLGATNIYQVIVKKFCDNRGVLSCNTLTALNSTIDPVYVNWERTGVTGVLSVNNNFTDADKLIDGNNATPAKLTFVANALSGATISVKNALSTYPAGTYVAFDVESNSVLSASVLAGGATIKLYKTGTLAAIQTSSGNGLLIGAKTTLLGNGRTRQNVGIVADVAFDEATIEFSQPVNANLGEVLIYGANIQKSCDHALECKTSNPIVNSPSGFGVVINNERSGISGAVCAGCSIENIGNVVDNNANNYARMIAAAGVAASSAISVHAPASTFPAGTIAGFTIRTNNTLVGLDLFKGITLEIWNNGTRVGFASGSQLLSLELLNLITIGSTQGAVYNVGFIAPAAYDEIRIVKDGLVSANVAASVDIDVYGATIDTRFVTPGTPGLSCPLFKTNPDINYTTINKPVKGSVATNDQVPSATRYTNATAINGADGLPNPAGATLTLDADGLGGYTFVTPAPGAYSYNVTASDGTNSEDQNLTIIVSDPAVTTNPPIANTDIAETVSPNPVTIDVLINDHVGNPGGQLTGPVIDKDGTNGHAVVTSSKVVYTPNPGFVGKDTVVYKITEAGKDAKAYIIIDSKPAGAANTTSATDDFAITDALVAVGGNVLTNDVDPEGDAHTVTAQNISDTKYDFTLTTDGVYNFKPKAGFSGTATFAYEAKDDKGATAKGTLYVYTRGGSIDVSLVLLASPSQVTGAKTVTVNATVFTVNNTETSGAVEVLINKSPNFTLNTYNTSTASALGQTVQNADWEFVGDDAFAYKFRLAAGKTITSASTFSCEFTFDGGNKNGLDNFQGGIIPGTGGDTNSVNNNDAEKIRYTMQ